MTRQDRPLISGLQTDLEGTETPMGVRYDEYSHSAPAIGVYPMKESGEKPVSIRLLKPDDHPCPTEREQTPSAFLGNSRM
jgi:hypothetical protein